MGTAGGYYTLQPTVGKASKTAIKAKYIRAGLSVKDRSLREKPAYHIECEDQCVKNTNCRELKGLVRLRVPVPFPGLLAMSICQRTLARLILQIREKVRDRQASGG